MLKMMLGSLQILRTGVLCWALLGLSSALVCPDGGMCEDRNTCCRNTEGGYGCCPLPHAECCSDHLHCCYQGTLCDLVHEKCVNKSVSLPWMSRVPGRPAPLVPQVRLKAVVCPDQESECPDDTTCCQLPDASWGCCFLAKAVCCEDKLHCCPEGTTCDLTHSRCVSPLLDSTPLLHKLPARRRGTRPAPPAGSPAPPAGSVLCPGGKSSCPQSTTCCLLTSGDYGCCPYPQATCCSDRIHCCPGDTTCDLEHTVCKSGEARFPLMRKVPAAPGNVVCPDQKSACPDQTTCCQTTNSSYGCCPMPSAVCCSDHVHCCPAGTQCDLQRSTCVSRQGIELATPSEVALAAVMELEAPPRRGHSVPCNDSVACAEGNTCCRSVAGEWACCPLPEAVCCDDHLHCCPHATVCNLEASTCDDPPSGAATPWLSKSPAVALTPDDSKCDRSTSCPGKATCCKTPSGDWACCPLPQAVCCDDHVHCCPHGAVCNLEAQTCDDPSGSSPSVRWLDKTPAVSSRSTPDTRDPPEVRCDRQTRCPGGTTCCRRGPGRWACCPLPQAVCCSDGEHCCPQGSSCNVARQTCDRPDGSGGAWLRKGPALRGAEPGLVGGNMCDGRTGCPRDTTCCFMRGTQRWGCCPLPDAVCCAGGDHCCPSGHSCDPHTSSCSPGPRLVPWFSKLSPRAPPAAVGDVKCDDKSSCAAGATCCKLPSGEWGCCPLVKAVCCTDHEHCCPQGYTCNMESGTCEKKNVITLPQTAVVRPNPVDDREERDVPCDGTGGFHCSSRETCCKTSETEWGCCPGSEAVCCPGSRSCCPAGSRCDLRTRSCSLAAPPSWDAPPTGTDGDAAL